VNKIPRASLSITLLRDEDFRVLMERKGGAEAFGIFVAMVLVGRDRLQESKARQLSECESLKFDDSQRHLAALACVSPKQLGNAIDVIREVAQETGGKPWMYIADDSHLVIRSFFKFNVSQNWGGSREGSGRRQKNQDEKLENQDETHLKKLEKPPLPSPLPSSINSPLPPDGGSGGGVAQVPDYMPAIHGQPTPEVQAVMNKAEALFPLNGWATLARVACQEFAPSWVSEALDIGADNRAANWKFILKILARFKAQGGPDSAMGSGPRASPPSKPEPEPRVHVAPPTSKWHRKNGASHE